MLACIGYYLSSLYDFIGLSYIGTGLERLILYVYPTIVVLLGAWFQRQRPARQLWQALALCYLGLLLAFGHDLGQHGDRGDVLIGEVSTVNDDMTDNIFAAPIGRFANVIEDEAPTHLLVSDYDSDAA